MNECPLTTWPGESAAKDRDVMPSTFKSHSQKLTAGNGPQNDGPWKAGNSRKKTWQLFGIYSLDFWGVAPSADDPLFSKVLLLNLPAVHACRGAHQLLCV